MRDITKSFDDIIEEYGLATYEDIEDLLEDISSITNIMLQLKKRIERLERKVTELNKKIK